jgi:hypothetical protein
MRPDGSRAWISVSTALVDLPAPYAGHGVVGSFVDVTAAVEARRALEHSEQRFRDLAELSADWYWEQDAEYRFVDMSRGATGHRRAGAAIHRPAALGLSVAQHERGGLGGAPRAARPA